jgi:BED zinc finger
VCLFRENIFEMRRARRLQVDSDESDVDNPAECSGVVSSGDPEPNVHVRGLTLQHEKAIANIWKHFKKINSTSAKCNYCSAQLKTEFGSQ